MKQNHKSMQLIYKKTGNEGKGDKEQMEQI